jgi:polysaccharide biosynthesis PFTS motif protein
MIISPLRQFANEIQKVDFLVDDYLINKNETIFISYRRLSKNNKKYLEKNQLNYLYNLTKFISFQDINRVLPFCLSLLFSCDQKIFILDTALRLIYYYLKWMGFTKNIKIDNLITHCDFGIQSIARNIILKQSGCKTYYYMDTANFGCFFAKKDSHIKYRHNNFGFLYYDYFVSWNDEVSRYFRDSQCRFKNYINLGCFWSEHLRRIEEGKIKSDFKCRVYQQGYREGMKLISVFDSTFHDNSITTYEDGIKFLQGILKLLEDLPNIFVVLKEKKKRNIHQKITDKFREVLDIYNKLENHYRCFCLIKYKGKINLGGER